MRLDEPAERLLGLGSLEPPVLGAVRRSLDGILAGCVHPSGLDEVRPDPIPHQRVGEVLRHGDQRPLRHRVRQQEGGGPVSGDGSHRDDRASVALTAHDRDSALDEQEWAANVHGEQRVEEFGRGVDDRCPVAERRGIDEDIEPSEVTVGLGDESAAVVDVCQFGLDEDGVGSPGDERVPDRGPPIRVPSGDHDPGGTFGCHPSGHSLSDSLRRPGDQRDLALVPALVHGSSCARIASSIRSRFGTFQRSS